MFIRVSTILQNRKQPLQGSSKRLNPRPSKDVVDVCSENDDANLSKLFQMLIASADLISGLSDVMP